MKKKKKKKGKKKSYVVVGSHLFQGNRAVLSTSYETLTLCSPYNHTLYSICGRCCCCGCCYCG